MVCCKHKTLHEPGLSMYWYETQRIGFGNSRNRGFHTCKCFGLVGFLWSLPVLQAAKADDVGDGQGLEGTGVDRSEASRKSGKRRDNLGHQAGALSYIIMFSIVDSSRRDC